MLTIYHAKTEEDVELVRGLLKEYLASWSGYGAPANMKERELFARQLADLPGRFGPPEGFLLLGKYNEDAAGCIALSKLSESVCEMKRLYVRTQFRGLRIGRQLADAIIEQAQGLGYESMRIHTIPAMEEAVGLYKSLGFMDIEPYEYSPREDAVFLELKL